MSAKSSEETIIRVSTARNEPIALKVEGGGSVTVRVEVESNCACQAGSTHRVGSYIDRDAAPA